MSRVLWDKDLHFTSTQSHHILEMVSGHQVRNFNGWRLCRYLPFFDNEGYISGLTMYSSGHRITGMTAHGRSSRSIGDCQGCPTHLHLQSNERIVSVWLRIPVEHSNYECNPNILVTPLLIYTQIATNSTRLQPVATVHVSLGRLFIPGSFSAGDMHGPV